MASELRHECCHRTRQRRLRSNGHAPFELLCDGGADEGGAVPEEMTAKAHGEVHVAIAVDVDQRRPLRLLGNHRVDHFLEQGAKTRRRPIVG